VKATTEQIYNDALTNLPNATRLEDGANGLWLYFGVYNNTLGDEMGYTTEEKTQHAATLQPLLSAKVPVMMADALSRLGSAGGSDLDALAGSYFLWAQVTSADTSPLTQLVNTWAQQAPTAPCSQQQLYSDRLNTGLHYLVPLSASAALDRAKFLQAATCANPDTAAADPSPAFADALQNDVSSMGSFISDLTQRLNNNESEDSLKEELAWKLAQQISDLTQPFSGGGSDEAKALWQVHQQAAFVLQYQSKSRTEMIAGALGIVADTVADLVPQQKNIAAAVSKALGGYLSNSNTNSTVINSLELIASLAEAFLPDSPAKQVLEGGYLGLASANGDSLTITSGVLTALRVGSGIGLAYSGNLVKNGDQIDFPASLAQLTQNGGAFWSSIGKDIPTVVSLADTLDKLVGMFETLSKAMNGTPASQMAAVETFISDASKLPKVGKFFAVVSQPEQNLLAPDRDRKNYFQNLLLAELGTSRNSLPSAGTVGFKSTCPSIDPSKGLVGGSLSGNGSLFCAIDLARDLIDGSIVAVVDPNSAEGMNEQASQNVDQMKKDALYAQAIGDEYLSGIYGGVTYRSGQLTLFKLVASFTLKGFMEVAMEAQWDETQNQFTFEYDNADERDAGLLKDFGLSPGANQLFNNSVGLSPIRTLSLQVMPNGMVGKIDLSLSTPFGGYETGEQDLAIWLDGSFDVKATVNYPVLGIYSVKPSVRLFYQNGNGGGLQLEAKVTVEPPAFVPDPVVWPSTDSQGRQGTFPRWGGPYASASLGVGLNAGVSGINTTGNGDAQAGVYSTDIPQSHCGDPGFEPQYQWDETQNTILDVNATPDGDAVYKYGNCHYGLDQQFDFLVGTDYNNFYLKGRTSVSILGIATVGVWIYGGSNAIDAGTGDFPSKYGGWTNNAGGGR
jgi:hypothetical protein